jgi:mono/diheme cytochrome c family protein
VSGSIACLLVSLLWLFADAVAVSSNARNPGKESPPIEQQDARPSGQADFDRVCKVCHGAEGRGDAGPRLVPFTREYEELLGIVREGAGEMPPISARELPDEGVARILAYLKSLSP